MSWWENRFLKAEKGKLFLENREAGAIAEEFGTPLFVYSRSQIQSNLLTLQNAFPRNIPSELRICFAMKSNPNIEILHFLRDRDVWIDAVSPGEVDLAVRAGFPPQKIIFTGTSVSALDIKRVFELDGVIVNIDAIEQLEIMVEIKKKDFPDKKISVAVRWNPGIGKGFSPKTVTAGRLSFDGIPIKFGIEEEQVLSAFQKSAQAGFQPVALHQHLGSGWKAGDLADVLLSVDKMKASELEKEGFPLEFLDFGGGFGPRYAENQEAFPLLEYARSIGEKVRQSGLKIKAIAVEPGKFLVGDAGILLFRVEYLKKSYGNLFACVNAGTFNTVPRPAIYAQAHHHILNCSEIDSDSPLPVTVAGNLCETGDVFGKNIIMPVPKRGDILALLCAGAYCRSMASNFNLRDIPKEILI
jgi:diaminopimelate decarboxylase